MSDYTDWDKEVLKMMGNHRFAKMAMDRGWRLISYETGEYGINDMSVANDKYSSIREYKTNGNPDDDTPEGIATAFLLCSLEWEMHEIHQALRANLAKGFLNDLPPSQEDLDNKALLLELKTLMDEVFADRKQRWENTEYA